MLPQPLPRWSALCAGRKYIECSPPQVFPHPVVHLTIYLLQLYIRLPGSDIFLPY